MGLNGKNFSAGYLEFEEHNKIAEKISAMPLIGERFNINFKTKKTMKGDFFCLEILKRELSLPERYIDSWEILLPEAHKNAQICPVPCCASFARKWFEGKNPKKEDYFDVSEDGIVDPFERNDTIIRKEEDLANAFFSWLYERFSRD
jgi:hypothetical protein